MNKGKVYRTRQGQLILQCLREQGEAYVTIQQIASFLNEKKLTVGLSTIYRNLEKLIRQGKIAKVNVDGVKGSCFRLLNGKGLELGFHLCCEGCGEILRLELPEVGELYAKIQAKHRVKINPERTMLYGLCDKCFEQTQSGS